MYLQRKVMPICNAGKVDLLPLALIIESSFPSPPVPADFFESLASLTQHGYRVLAVAHKTMHMPWHKAERVQR